MPVRCQDCNSHFLLDGTTVAQGIGCPDCGGTKLERDQPSPTHSDGQLTNMVDPATQIDAGGNPLQEGVWANIDGGWQPRYKRDETFAKVAGKYLPQSGMEPQVHGTAENPQLHMGNMYWLNLLDAHINGEPVRENYEAIHNKYGLAHDHTGPVTISVHHPEHLAAAIEAAENPLLKTDKTTLIHSPIMQRTGLGIFTGILPAPPGVPAPQQQAPRVMSNHYNRALPQDPYLPWYHQADVQRFDGDGGAPVTLTNEEWAADRKDRYQQRQNQQSGHRLEWMPGQRGRGIMIGGRLHTWPVNPTNEDPQGGLRHGEYVSHLGVNPQNVDFTTGFEIDPDGKMTGSHIPPQAAHIDPFLNEGQEEAWGADDFTASTKLAIAPLLAIGGRLLLGQAIGGLMRKAIGGQGNFLQQAAPPGQDPYGGSRPVGLVASERLGVGHNAPVETPDSTPDLVEDHDPESVDQQEFNDGDMSPAGNNPNLNGEAGGSQNPAGGEDQTVQKLEFRHDGEGVGHAEMLLPVIMEYINSDKSALENPQLKALHEQLEKEIPGYLDLADENDESVHKLMEELRKPEHVHARTAYMGEATMPANQNPQADFIQQALRMVEYYESIGNHLEAEKYKQMAIQAGHQFGQHQMAASTHEAAPVYQGTPIPQAQMQMNNQQMAMPGTFQNPVQPGGMPVSGKCQNCGGVVNADGSCPQCGAAAGANQQGNLQAAPHPGQQTTPVGIMPSQYANTAANHQGPITPQQKDAFAEYLIQQGRDNEVATMHVNPAMYADEWAQFINKSTQPPEVDPNEQPAPPQPPMDPSQMGQMPVPGMSIPQPTAKTAGPLGPFDMSDGSYPLPSGGEGQYHSCPNCGGQMSDTGECFRCGYSYGRDGETPAVNMPVHPSGLQPLGPIHQGKTADNGNTSPRRCPNCTSATTTPMNADGDMRCHRCGHQWSLDLVEDHPVVKSNWQVRSIVDPIQPNQSPANPVAAPAADATAPGDREQQADSTMSWQSSDGTPLQVGQTYEMHNPGYAIPDVVKIEQVKPDSIVVTMEGEYNSPTDPQDANGPGYQHEITLQEAQTEGLTFNPSQTGEGDQEQSQDQNDQDGIGQTVNTEPTRQSPEVPYHASLSSEPAESATDSTPSQQLPTDHCPKCDYGHVTSSYNSPTEIAYECFRCAHQWKIADEDEGSALATDTREWLNEDDGADGFNFDRVIAVESAKGKGRNIRDIAARDPRNKEIHDRLAKNAGAKFSPREQKEFIDEEGTARNADRLNLDGTHYVESAFDNTGARPERVNDAYLGLGL